MVVHAFVPAHGHRWGGMLCWPAPWLGHSLLSVQWEDAAVCFIMAKVNKKEEETLEQKGIKVGDVVSTKYRSGKTPAYLRWSFHA